MSKASKTVFQIRWSCHLGTQSINDSLLRAVSTTVTPKLNISKPEFLTQRKCLYFSHTQTRKHTHIGGHLCLLLWQFSDSLGMLSSFSGRSWEQEAERRFFLSARCRRGKTLWRNRSFFGFTCRTWQGPSVSPALAGFLVCFLCDHVTVYQDQLCSYQIQRRS